MAEQCFCHLNGFKVKDADARKKIEELEKNSATNEALQQVNEKATFYDTNSVLNLYVSNDGNDENNGLSEVTPFLTIAKALRYVTRLVDKTGQITINIKQGTYTESVAIQGVRGFKNYLTINGNGSIIVSQNGESCMALDCCEKVKINDLTFKDATKYGLVAYECSFLRLSNCFAENVKNTTGNGAGFSFLDHTYYSMVGGGATNCDYAISEYFGVVRDFSPSGSTENGFKARNCNMGLYSKELCTGHLNYFNAIECDFGVHLTRNCTANMTDGVIHKCGVGAVLMNSSNLAGTHRIDFGIKTENANTINWQIDATSQFVYQELGLSTKFYPLVEKIAHVSPTGITANTIGTTLLDAGLTTTRGAMSKENNMMVLDYLFGKTGGIEKIQFKVGNGTGSILEFKNSMIRIRQTFKVISKGVQKVITEIYDGDRLSITHGDRNIDFDYAVDFSIHGVIENEGSEITLIHGTIKTTEFTATA